jgi:O-antigen ligase
MSDATVPSASMQPTLPPLGVHGSPRDPAWHLRTAAIALLLLSNFAGRVLPANPVILLSLMITGFVLLFYRPGVARVYLSLSGLVAISWVFATVLWSILPSTTLRRAISFSLVAIGASILGSISPSENVRAGIRLACRITIGGSIALAVLLPGWAISPPDQTEPGFIGLAFQKNQLGFIACLGLAAEGLDVPSRTRKFWFVAYIGSVLLSQSSTALVVMLLVLAFLFSIRGVGSIRDRGLKVAFVLALAAPGMLLFTLVFVNPGALTGLLGKDAGLTGRDVIWGTVMEYIRERPLLGYGWNTVWPTQSGGFAPSEVASETVRRAGFEVINAHNGYLDLVLGGGLVALVLFVTVLLVAPGRSPFAPHSAWRTALILAFAVNSFSESNFSLGFVGVVFLLVASRNNGADTRGMDATRLLAAPRTERTAPRPTPIDPTAVRGRRS